MGKECVVCKGALSGQKQKYCSNRCKQYHHYHRVKQQTNTYHSQTIRALKRKLQLIEMKGGSCECCGYDSNIAALHFHHVDPDSKLFKLDHRILSNRSLQAINEEAKKCVLLCANCHYETHHPESTIENIKKIIHGASFGKPGDEQGVNSGNPKSE
jgi:predicted nucleic acid-binding Zn ribbon protein